VQDTRTRHDARKTLPRRRQVQEYWPSKSMARERHSSLFQFRFIPIFNCFYLLPQFISGQCRIPAPEIVTAKWDPTGFSFYQMFPLVLPFSEWNSLFSVQSNERIPLGFYFFYLSIALLSVSQSLFLLPLVRERVLIWPHHLFFGPVF